MKRCDIRTYWDLRDCLCIWGGGSEGDISGIPAGAVRFGDYFTDVVETMTGADKTDHYDAIFKTYPIFTWASTQWETDSRVVGVLNLLSARFRDNWAAWGDEDDPQTVFVEAWDRLFAEVIGTFDRYSVLLQGYAEVKAHLLDPVEVETSNVAKVKDTPQSVIDPFSDSYNAAVTVNTGTVKDGRLTNPEKLRAVWDNYRAILRDWSDDIGRIFIDRANI